MLRTRFWALTAVVYVLSAASSEAACPKALRQVLSTREWTMPEAKGRALLSTEGEASLDDRKFYATTSSPTYRVLSQLEGFLGRDSGKHHKALWPLSRGDIVGFVLTWIVLLIAAGGGIGGGGAIIPLYILFLGFGTRVAVALGNITIVGGALSNFVFNAPRRHETFNRPLVDWDLILVMEPATILGALVGGYLNKLFPSWLTTVLLALLLTFISYKLLVRGLVSWKRETADFKHAALHSEDVRRPLLEDEEEAPASSRSATTARSRPITSARSKTSEQEHHSPLAYTSSLSHGLTYPQNGEDRDSRDAEEQRPLSRETELSDDESPERLDTVDEGPRGTRPPASDDSARAEDGTATGLKQQDIDEAFAERRQIPPLRFGILFLLTAVVAASDYLKSLVKCAEWRYWLIVFAIVPVVGLVTFGARNYLLKKRKRKQAAGYVWQEGDVDWNSTTTLTYPAICSVAGLVAGMFGVGGGIVKGPLMLELGVSPDVASATSATMIVFTSASASIVFLSFGGIPTDYAIACFVIGLVMTMIGQIACYELVKLLHRRSIIIFAMAVLMLLSMVIVDYEAVVSIIAAVKGHHVWRFGRLCT